MMLDKSVLAAGAHRRRLTTLSDQDHPVAGQIVGGEPETMAAAARALCRMGFDVIDINLACPVPKTLRRQRGGYLMTRPDLALEIIRAVIAASDRPVTVKLRRKFGQDDTDDAFWRIAEGAFQAAAAGLTVHARSVAAKYAGPADWQFLKAVKGHFPDRTILGSGDMLTPHAALEALSWTRLDAVVAARGALGNPWFFRQARDLAGGRQGRLPSLAEQAAALLEHCQAACELYGPVCALRNMRKFGIRYAKLHPDPRAVRAAFARVKRPEHWRGVVETFYGC
jgi:nifR3 family TIM-barrel protein